MSIIRSRILSVTIKISFFTQDIGLVLGRYEFTNAQTLNDKEFFFTASVAKLFIAAAILCEIEKGKVQFSTLLPHKNRQLTVTELLTSMLSVIDNLAPVALIEHIGRDTAENYLKTWGLTNTYLYNPTKGSKNQTTAGDIAKFLKKLWLRELGIRKSNTQFFLSLLEKSQPRAFYVSKDIQDYQKTGELQSIRLNISLFHSVGIFFNPTSQQGGLYCFLSVHKGFWTKKKQLRLLNQHFGKCFPNISLGDS